MKNGKLNFDIHLYIDKMQELGLFFQDVENKMSYPNKMWGEMGFLQEEMIDMGFLNFVHPDDLQNVKESMEQFLSSKNSPTRSLFRMKTKSGNWRWILSTCLGVEYNDKGKLTKYIGYDHDVSEEIKAKKEAETLRSVAEIITSDLDLTQTTKAILEQAERVISFTSASVQLLEGDQLEIVGEKGFKPERNIVGLKFNLSDDIPNTQIIKGKKGILINQGLYQKYKGFDNMPDLNIRSWLGVPLIYKNKITGIMTFDHSLENQFCSEDLRLAEAFGHQVAIALENSRLYEATKELAIKDSLTGCFTRRHLYESLKREYEIAKRYENNLALILFDIDDFKKINDTYGHVEGDEVLKEIVKLTSLMLRKTDILCRYGGEEFVALLPLSNIDEAFTAAERIRQSVYSDLRNPSIKRPISISLGCTIYKSQVDKNPEMIIQRADKALYNAKNNGKNQTCTL